MKDKERCTCTCTGNSATRASKNRSWDYRTGTDLLGYGG
jgi:hypothetical protein